MVPTHFPVTRGELLRAVALLVQLQWPEPQWEQWPPSTKASAVSKAWSAASEPEATPCCLMCLGGLNTSFQIDFKKERLLRLLWLYPTIQIEIQTKLSHESFQTILGIQTLNPTRTQPQVYLGPSKHARDGVVFKESSQRMLLIQLFFFFVLHHSDL